MKINWSIEQITANGYDISTAEYFESIKDCYFRKYAKKMMLD